MTRYIDADALIEDIRKHSESYFADDFAHEWVDRQPTIGTEPQWIPVSERLPETYGEYIVTRKTEYGIKTKTSLYYENGIWWPPEEVIAWMDLPEPYKDPNNDD